MNEKWTPGPWKIANIPGIDGEGIGYRVFAPRGCVALAFSPSVGAQHTEANALLIAAAPEMHEALEILLVEHARASVALGLPLPADTPGSIAARAALAKARGEEKIVPCSVCPTCNGYGYFQWQGKYKERCSSCDGTGRQN